MKKKLLTIFLIIFTILLYGQNKIKGQLIDPYGEIGFSEIKVNNEKIQFDFDSGKFEIETSKNENIEIDFTLPGYFKLKYIIESKNEMIDLDKVHLIECENWLHGPKKGIIKDKSDSGVIESERKIRNWKLHGISKFYNKSGELTQRILFKKNKPIKIYILENGIMKKLKFEFDEKNKIITVPNNS
ncbi:hypothetical protein [Lutibacter sp. B1]|uniref:hypothetical protein n=1 Tax=Lutibacter sp. B1 TaxID=2725996 RepID=UPI00145710C5|nr:hypothetical protein [Lutibacter sp. B1]NLP59352.1 hypothetical protein [Lutibacter sp. B1]